MKEAELSLKLDTHYSKNDILRLYLATCTSATVFTACRQRPTAISV